MKPVVLHPGSVVVGVALAALGLVAAGAQAPQVQSFLHPPPRIIEHHIVGINDPRDAIVLREAAGPYTVPAGKLFVLTALGDPGSGQQVNIYVNGQSEITRVQNFTGPSEPFSSISEVPPGFTARAGDILQLGVSGNGRAWGYLIDE